MSVAHAPAASGRDGPRPDQGLEFRLLGPVEVHDCGRRVPLGGVRRVELLALLLLHANQPVSIQRIIRGLWAEPPTSARESVHYYVHQLRKALPHDQGDRQGVLESAEGGYRLRVPPERIDVVCFQRSLAQADAARSHGDHQLAVRAYTEGLDLWRGYPLLGASKAPFAADAVARLGEQRLVALERRAAAGLALGQHERLVGELEGLVAEQPGREGLYWLLMLALYRSGRQAHALAVYQDARARLVETLGIDPGPALQRLQQQILAHDPALDLPDGPAEALPGQQLAAPAAAPSLPPSPPQTHTAVARTPPAPSAPSVAPAAPASPDTRRLVTVLVAEIVADPDQTSGDPEDSRARTAALWEELTRRITHYGGVAHPTPIGKLEVCFGLDGSRDDDPERAVRAALALVGSPSESDQLGPVVCCGVATGAAIVIPQPRGAGGVVGDIVEHAVALAQAARPGTVLVTATTQQATSRRINYQPAPAAGTAAWLALAPRARTGAHTPEPAAAPLVEREQELALMGDVLTRLLRDREPQCLTLVSDAGLGKSRLVAELACLVDQAPELVSWRVGHVRAYGQGPLGALADIVKAETGVLDGDDGPTILRRLQETTTGLLGVEAASVAASLGQLVGVTSANRQQRLLFDDWAAFFAAAAQQRPLVLVIEDLHWADDVLLEFLELLAQQVGGVPLLLVGTGRPEFLDRRGGWGSRQRNAATITLRPLSRKGASVLLDALLEDAAREDTAAVHPRVGNRLPEAIRAALLDAADGNPLYMEEYVHTLTGHQEDSVAGGEPLPIPTSVVQVIAGRIDTLPGADRRLLHDAAVAGERGWVGQLTAVGGWSREQVTDGLRRLQRRGFLRRLRTSSAAGEVEWTFRHTLLRDVVYRQLLRADRVAKHQRAAAWIESMGPDARVEHVELLAYHYDRAFQLTYAAGQPTAELTERARASAAMAGDRAAALGSFLVAARRYQQALDLGPTNHPDRAGLLLRLGHAQVFGGLPAQDALQRAHEQALASGDQELAAEADALLALEAITRGRWTTATQYTQRGLRTPAAGGDPAAAALSAMAGHAVCMHLADRHADALASAQQLVTLARKYGMGDPEGLGLHVAGATRILAGDLDGGLADCQRGMALLEANRSPWQVFAWLGLARALLWYGDLARCAEAVAAGQRLAVDTGGYAHYLDSVQTGVDYAAGRWEKTITVAERVLAQPADRSNARVQATCLLFRSRVLLARGHLDDALADAEHALGVLDPDDLRYHQLLLALQGRILLAAGDPEGATGCLEDLLASQRKRPAESCATPDQAVVLLALGYRAEALPDGLAPTRWHQAVRAYVAGDLAAAAALYAAIGSVVDADAAHSPTSGAAR